MGVRAKTITGARAKLYVEGRLAGIFTSVNYDVAYGTTPIYILGRYNAAELVYTDMDVVTVNASGFRVLDNGPYELAAVPQLQELLNHEDISLQIVDRQSNQAIMTLVGVRPVGYGTGTSARGIQDLNVRFQGTTLSDEAGPQEDAGAVDFG